MPKKKLGKTNLEISRIGLGTTGIGFVYGIGPRNVPGDEKAEELLKKAISLGINFIDTAHFYGKAEDIIGKSGVSKMKGVIVATKAGHVLDRAGSISNEELEKTIREEVENSRKKLQLETLPLVIYHGGSKEQIESGLLIRIMEKLKDEGKIQYCGISTRGEDAPLAAIESGFFDVIQIAYSILDQRMASKILPEARKNNIGVINRSVFLKGALTEASKYLPDELMELKKNSDKAKEIAESIGADLPSLALRFAISNENITTSLIGTNKIEHIKSAIKAMEAGPLPDNILGQLKKLAIDDGSLVDPAHWPKLVTHKNV